MRAAARALGINMSSINNYLKRKQKNLIKVYTLLKNYSFYTQSILNYEK